MHIYLTFLCISDMFFKCVDNFVESNLFSSVIWRFLLSYVQIPLFTPVETMSKTPPSFQDNPPAIDFIYRDKTSSASHHCRIMNTLHPSAFLCVFHIFHIKNAHIQSIAKIILFIIIHKYFSSF